MGERRIGDSQCDRCNKETTKERKQTGRELLCSECSSIRRRERGRVVVAPCKECGEPVTLTGRRGLQQAREGVVYCSKEHKSLWTKRRWSENGKLVVQKHALVISERMRRANPMLRQDVRERVAVKTRLRGWPEGVIRGGNGRPLPAPQRLLACALGWPTEVVVSMGKPRPPGLPSAYKVDIGQVVLKVGIEVDGSGHNGRVAKARDVKKETALCGLGWTVLRFTNKQVTVHLEDCVQMVLSTISKLKGQATTRKTT